MKGEIHRERKKKGRNGGRMTGRNGGTQRRRRWGQLRGEREDWLIDKGMWCLFDSATFISFSFYVSVPNIFILKISFIVTSSFHFFPPSHEVSIPLNYSRRKFLLYHLWLSLKSHMTMGEVFAQLPSLLWDHPSSHDFLLWEWLTDFEGTYCQLTANHLSNGAVPGIRSASFEVKSGTG